MKIIEVFDSIQGEGSWMGIPVTFIRTAGCSLKCEWCDTKESWDKNGRIDLSVDDISSLVHYPNVVITGGEPTEQPAELKQLIRTLKKRGIKVAIESNGTYEHYDELGADWVVVSPKPKAMYAVFPKGVNELKYVVTKDFEHWVAIPRRLREIFAGHIWLQPCDYGNADDNREMFKKVCEIAMHDAKLRVGIQLHKVLEVK